MVTASVRGALQPLAAGLADAVEVHLAVGGRGHDLAEVSARLVELAYHRVDMVSRRGEFALRGGILDVFPPIADHPYRVEFFGDEVDQIRAFSVADQRSLPGEVHAVDLPASRELLLTQAVRDRARQLKDEFPGIRGMLEKMAEGIPAEGMESLIPALVDDIVTVVDYLPEGSAIALVDPERSVTRAITLLETNREFLEAAWSAATAGAATPVDLGSGDFVSLPEPARGRRRARHRVVDAQRVRFGGGGCLGRGSPGGLPSPMPARRSACPARPSRRSRATSTARPRTSASCSPTDGASWSRHPEPDSSSARATCSPSAASRRDGSTASWSRPSPASRTSCSRRSSAGFEAPEAKLAVLTETEFYGRTIGGDQRLVKKLASRRRNVVDPLQLKTGDYVVHVTHGIGKFVELTQREVSSGGRNPVKSVREYLVLEYAPSKRGYPGDKLYVPTDQLDLLSKLRRRRGAHAVARWAAATGRRRRAGPSRGARHRRRARQALLRPHGGQGPRLRPRHPLAARARGGVPVRRDPRSASDDR